MNTLVLRRRGTQQTAFGGAMHKSSESWSQPLARSAPWKLLMISPNFRIQLYLYKRSKSMTGVRTHGHIAVCSLLLPTGDSSDARPYRTGSRLAAHSTAFWKEASAVSKRKKAIPAGELMPDARLRRAVDVMIEVALRVIRGDDDDNDCGEAPSPDS